MKRTLAITIIVMLMHVFYADSVLAQWVPNDETILWTNDQVGIGIEWPYPYSKMHIKHTLNYGSNIALYNNVSALTSTYGFIGDVYAHVCESGSWSYNGLGVGVVAYSTNVTRMKNTESFKTSQTGGGYFRTFITDPIPSGNSGIGTYLIYGTRSQLNGTITNYPSNGIVSAVIAEDNILGSGTWAGYFKGNIFCDGNMGLGIKTPGEYKLAINGKVWAKEVIIESEWADYVFEDSYDLIPIEKLELFIRENKHLPNIPTTTEIKSTGLPLGSMNKLLLEKIEELTLYIINQEKRIKQLEEVINNHLP